MSDTTSTADQARAWELRLHMLGVTTGKLRITRQLGERILAALEDIPESTIEEDYGFGDYTRGLATLAAMVSVDWVGVPSA